MFYQPFNPKTFKVYDLTRSTLTEPYELDYGFSDILDDTSYYASLPNDKDHHVSSMLSPKEREISYPHLFLNEQDVKEIISYSLRTLANPNDDYCLGYAAGYADVVKFNYRKTFETLSLRTMSFLAGYEIGVYVAIMHRKAFKDSL